MLYKTHRLKLWSSRSPRLFQWSKILQISNMRFTKLCFGENFQTLEGVLYETFYQWDTCLCSCAYTCRCTLSTALQHPLPCFHFTTPWPPVLSPIGMSIAHLRCSPSLFLEYGRARSWLVREWQTGRRMRHSINHECSCNTDVLLCAPAIQNLLILCSNPWMWRWGYVRHTCWPPLSVRAILHIIVS